MCITNLDEHVKEASFVLSKYSAKPNTKITKCIQEIQKTLRLIN